MLSIFLSALKSEIQNDPQGLGYAAHLPSDPLSVANLLNAPTQSMVKPITSAVAMSWAASGPYASIVDAANNTSHPCRASCLVVRETLASGLDINLDHPDVKSMFDGWQAAGVITQSQHDALISLAIQPASRAEVLGWPVITYKDVCDIFWNADGSAR